MTPEQASAQSEDICRLAPVIPVLVVKDASTAADLARALVKGGLPALEVTLRTDAALDVIREMSTVEGGVVGAGTLLTPAVYRRPRMRARNSASRPVRPTASSTPA
jgi:2-dehydro-3-deoxyphosphogluconate aldolase/(4S)-4-hydroxy-2-oxoglutarate aldolase